MVTTPWLERLLTSGLPQHYHCPTQAFGRLGLMSRASTRRLPEMSHCPYLHETWIISGKNQAWLASEGIYKSPATSRQ